MLEAYSRALAKHVQPAISEYAKVATHARTYLLTLTYSHAHAYLFTCSPALSLTHLPIDLLSSLPALRSHLLTCLLSYLLTCLLTCLLTYFRSASTPL